MGETAGGWGPAVAGEPPQGESLPEEETPPQQAGDPNQTPVLRASRTVHHGEGSEARAEGSPSLTLECGSPSDSLWGSGGDLVHRLECLQRIVSKLQMEAGLCEEQLNQADSLLQSVSGERQAEKGRSVL